LKEDLKEVVLNCHLKDLKEKLKNNSKTWRKLCQIATWKTGKNLYLKTRGWKPSLSLRGSSVYLNKHLIYKLQGKITWSFQAKASDYNLVENWAAVTMIKLVCCLC
jgi:hypothetical protein